MARMFWIKSVKLLGWIHGNLTHWKSKNCSFASTYAHSQKLIWKRSFLKKTVRYRRILD